MYIQIFILCCHAADMKDVTPNGSEGKTTTDEVSKRLSSSQSITAPLACFKTCTQHILLPFQNEASD